MVRAFSSLLLALCCLLASCGGDSHEALAADTVSLMNELTEVLTEVTDKKSAEESLPRLEKILEGLKEAEAREAELEDIDQAEMERIAGEVGMEEAFTGFIQQGMRISMNPELNAILEPTMTKMGEIGK